MKTFLRNGAAVLAGILVGTGVNMALVLLGPLIIPPPAGVDMSQTESLKASIHLLQPKHFLFPFLAHALGTLGGAGVAFLLAASYRRAFAYGIGTFFLAGGIAAAAIIPAPGWFIAVDLLGAYLPMAWLATWLGGRIAGTGRGAVGQPS
jgi:hypothetical protein